MGRLPIGVTAKHRSVRQYYLRLSRKVCSDCKRPVATKLIIQNGREVFRKELTMCWKHLQAMNELVKAKYYANGGHPWKSKARELATK